MSNYKPTALLAPSAFKKNRKRNLAAGRALEDPDFGQIDLTHVPEILEHDELAQKAWHDLEPILTRTKVMSLADVKMFIIYCQTYADLQRDQHTVALDGRTITTPQGVLARHPLLGVIQSNRTLILQISQQFGITPSSRSRVASEQEPKNVTPSLAEI